ncbi:MAG: TetR/AcrR family transcriptional regulator [Brevinematales bacterium]|jgi:AcrR family transcriptional regulator
MNNKRDSGDTKEAILGAAKEIMIKKGYDEAKMEEIARKAGVSKVMLYYHFQSKENILKELIGRIIGSAKLHLSEIISGLKKLEELKVELILSKLRPVFGREAAFLRIIISEVLRGKLDYEIVLSLLKDFYFEIYDMTNKDGNQGDRDSYITKMLFFQGLPLIMYYCISEDVSRVYGIGIDKIEKAFSDKFTDSLMRTLKLN